MNLLYFTYGIAYLSFWWDLTYKVTSKLLANMKDESTKQSKNGDNIVQPSSLAFISTNPKLLKNARKM
jgi:hypothetical protein